MDLSEFALAWRFAPGGPNSDGYPYARGGIRATSGVRGLRTRGSPRRSLQFGPHKANANADGACSIVTRCNRSAYFIFGPATKYPSGLKLMILSETAERSSDDEQRARIAHASRYTAGWARLRRKIGDRQRQESEGGRSSPCWVGR